MRLFVITALSVFATPALACGMYIPDDMLLVGIGELMDEVDETPEIFEVQQVAQAAEPTQAEVDAANASLLAALVGQPAVQVEPVTLVAEVSLEPAHQLTRKERRQMKRRARSAGV